MNTEYASWEGEVGSELCDVVTYFGGTMFIMQEKLKNQNLKAVL